MKNITEEQARAAVSEAVDGLIKEFKDQPDVDRETVMERLDEYTDDVFGSLVKQGRVSDYNVDDLVETAQPCATIIKVADEDAWVEDDSGLWDGLTFGVLASIAYFSLRNLLYKALEEKGHDTNDEHPFAAKDGDEDAE